MRLFTRSVRFAIRYFALGLVLAGALACAGAARAEPDLLTISTKLVPEPVTGTMVIDHPWLSDHQVLHSPGDSIWLYDTNKKTDTKLGKLSKEMFDGIGYLIVEVSPGGKYVAWNHDGSGWETADIAGKDHVVQQATEFSWVHWCPNGRTWERFDDSLQQSAQSCWIRVTIFEVGNPERKPVVRAIPVGLRNLDILATPSATMVIARVSDRSHTIPQQPKPRRSPNGHVEFTYHVSEENRRVQTVSAWDLSTGAKMSQWTIHLPGPCFDYSASQDGKRLAWLVYPKSSRKDVWPASIWISNLDGTDLHEVGTSDNTDISEIQWVPGDNAISFHSDYWLYEVPAP